VTQRFQRLSVTGISRPTAIDLKRGLNWAVEQTPELRKPMRRWWIGVAAAAVVALGLGGGWLVSRVGRPAAEEQLLHFQITPPKGPASYFSGLAPSLSVSPDGRFVTYRASVNGSSGIWLHPLDGSQDQLLVDSADNSRVSATGAARKSLEALCIRLPLYRSDSLLRIIR
jgi:hypothetical protein